MLRFLVYENGKPAERWALSHAQLIGPDDIGVRALLDYEDGLITCQKATLASAALSLQMELDGVGELMLHTCLLPEREEPYLLMLELARHRLMKCLAKQEDWAMFDLDAAHPAARGIERARRLFVDALTHLDDPAEADRLARLSLAEGINASEELALAHAEGMLRRRCRYGHLLGNIFGTGVGLDEDYQKIGPTLLSHFDYVRLPTPWRRLEPAEQKYDWKALDTWCEWATGNRLPVVAGPVVSFGPETLPDWMYIWEHDYETIRDLTQEHIERTVTRYRGMVSLWNVISGVHVNDHFSFNFEQLMDLSRLAVTLTKKIHPTSRTLIEIAQPFGEYYARNQRSIPPVMYAEMALQAGVPFDAIGIKLLMGQPRPGQWARDLMQISSLLDRFNALGKPLHVTAVAAPSGPQDEPAEEAEEAEDHGEAMAAAGAPGHEHEAPLRCPPAGYWREPWCQDVQALWLEAVYKVALSKPFVESVAWLDLVDRADSEMPRGGLFDRELKPKYAMRRLAALRRSLEEYDER